MPRKKVPRESPLCTSQSLFNRLEAKVFLCKGYPWLLWQRMLAVYWKLMPLPQLRSGCLALDSHSQALWPTWDHVSEFCSMERMQRWNIPCPELVQKNFLPHPMNSFPNCWPDKVLLNELGCHILKKNLKELRSEDQLDPHTILPSPLPTESYISKKKYFYFSKSLIFCSFSVTIAGNTFLSACWHCCCVVTKMCPTLLWSHELWPARLLCP